MIEILIFIDGALYNVIGLFFVALGILALIRHTGFPDLTVDGSFTVGAAVFATTLVATSDLALALVACFVMGTLAGMTTAFVNQALGLTKIVASVVSMTVFILVAPYVAGGATIGLLRLNAFQQALTDVDRSMTAAAGITDYSLHFVRTAFWILIAALAGTVLWSFMRSKVGTRLRYVGSATAPSMISATGARTFTFVGLMLGNGLVAIGGGIEAVRRGGYTANMGIGTILLGLTILILGEALLKIWLKRDYLRLGEQITAIIIGLLAYSVVLQIILRFGIGAVDLKLITTILLLGLLAIAGRFFPNSSRLF